MRRQKIIWVLYRKKTLEVMLRGESRRITQVSHIPGVYDESHNSNIQVDNSNNVKCQLDATGLFYWCILSSTFFGYIRPSSRALDVELQHMVFCTEFLDGWWSWEPLRRSYVRCGWCRAAPFAPYTRPKQRISRPSPIQKLGAENHMLQLNIHCS